MKAITKDAKHKMIHPGQSFQEWLNLLFRPNQFFSRLKLGEIKDWVFPMVLLSMALISQSIAQGISLGRLNQTQPTGFFLSVSILFNLASLWIIWLWASSVLRSFTILTGIRCPEWQPRVIIAWILTPFVFRYLVRLTYTLLTATPVTTSGLSGFLAQPTNFISVFMSQILAQTDFYLVWQIILLWIGLKYLPTIRLWQRLTGLLITIFNMLILYTLLNTLAVFLQIL